MSATPRAFWNRRDLLKLGGLAAGALSLGTATSCARKGGRPRNVVFMVSDGMSTGVPALAQAHQQLHFRKNTFWHNLSVDAETTHGLFDMASLDSLVTDSAAAASAWGSGRRVPNRMLNQFPDGTTLKPLCPILKEKGYGTGLVTTARMTHATPAGFSANAAHRDFEDEIASQYLGLVDVLLGGGDLHFAAEYRNDGRDLIGEFTSAGYAHCRTKQELLKSAGKEKVLGLFYPDHFPYSIDQANGPASFKEIPTLAEMTLSAFKSLQEQPKGFFLMVEAARVDHAAHANDAAAIIQEQLAFDEAVGVALDFLKKNPETLIVITSDHGNANPGLNGMGPSFSESTGFLRRVARIKGSATQIKQDLDARLRQNKAMAKKEVQDLVASYTGFMMAEEEALVLLDVLQGKGSVEISGQQRNFYGLLGQIMGNWHGVGWTGVTHTADWTLCMSAGPGRESFTGLMRNEEFFGKVLELFGISHSNPKYQGPDLTVTPDGEGVVDPTG